MSETDLLHAFMARIPYDLPHVHVERRNILSVKTENGRYVRNGIRGQCDAFVVVDGGRHIEIETKSATGKLTGPQVKWQRNCVRRRIPHLVLTARRGELPEDTVARWVTALRTVIEAK
jgi:hypothetical protein